jgi:hypothetical protein
MAYISVDEKPQGRHRIAFPLPYRTSLRGNKQVELRRVLKEVEMMASTSPPPSPLLADGAGGVGGSPRETTRVLDHVWHLLNYEIVECGDSYPFPPRALTREQCLEYFGGGELFVLVETNAAAATRGTGDREVKESSNTFHNKSTGASYDFGSDVLGAFYIKPNYPYRSSLVCNGGFMVTPQYQNSGLGVGSLLGSLFVVLAADLGYTGGSMFNLVYSTNTGSIRLWQKLRVFKLAHTIPHGGHVKATPSTLAALATLKNTAAAAAHKKNGQQSQEQLAPQWTADRVLAECVVVNAAGESVLVVDALQFYCDVVASAPAFRSLLEGRRTGSVQNHSKL